MTHFFSRGRAVSAGTLLALSLFVSQKGFADDNPGAVYAMTNTAAGNSILIFNRAANGALTNAGSVPTSGKCKGSGSGSQGALTLTADHGGLLAVNAGSNDI